jgi:hypothetical protein
MSPMAALTVVLRIGPSESVWCAVVENGACCACASRPLVVATRRRRAARMVRYESQQRTGGHALRIGRPGIIYARRLRVLRRLEDVSCQSCAAVRAHCAPSACAHTYLRLIDAGDKTPHSRRSYLCASRGQVFHQRVRRRPRTHDPAAGARRRLGPPSRPAAPRPRPRPRRRRSPSPRALPPSLPPRRRGPSRPRRPRAPTTRNGGRQEEGRAGQVAHRRRSSQAWMVVRGRGWSCKVHSGCGLCSASESSCAEGAARARKENTNMPHRR